MTGWLLGRTLEAVLIVALMSAVIFGLISLMPGDPLDLMFFSDPRLTAEDRARLVASLGLDRPWLERFREWAALALEGNFGYSRLYAQPVLPLIGDRMGNTLVLMISSLVLSLGVGGFLGILAGIQPHRLRDRVINFSFFVGISVPAFWLALLLILLFSVEWSLLPSGGIGRGTFQEKLAHLILPVASLSLPMIAVFGRFMRAEMLQTIGCEYILAARAHGLGEHSVVWRHALRNALLPMVTLTGLQVGQIFSGALITEIMFSYPGMGKMMFDAIMGNDYNLALVGLLIATVAALAGNMGADLLYAVCDPRIRLGGRQRAAEPTR